MNAPAGPDYVWAPGGADCRLRKEPVAGVVWHWTAGQGAPDAVVRTLQHRGLSIHYVIGYDGALKRCADPATTVCYHAGSRANGRLVGIEIVNPAVAVNVSSKFPRDTVAARAHGRPFVALDFTPAQYATIVALADELSERFGIPRVTAPGYDVIDVRKFAGHCEHIHVSKRKIDCGGLVMRWLRSHGYG